MTKSPQITLSDEFLRKRGKIAENKNNNAMMKFYLYYCLHMLIPLYGVATVFFQFFKLWS